MWALAPWLLACTKLDRAFLDGAKWDVHQEEPFPALLGAAGKELRSWKEDEDACFLKHCFSSSSLFSLASSRRSVLRFIVPLVSPFCYQPPISGLPFLKKGPLAGREAPVMPTNVHREAFQPPFGFN